MQSLKKAKGFTLIELTFVLAIIAILTAFILPYFQGIKNESKITRAEAEVAILKNAIENYYLQRNAFPGNITSDLIGNTPRIINKILADPFKTDSSTTPPTYGYIKTDKYYIVFSKSLDPVAQNWQIIADSILDKNEGCQNIIESNLEIRE